MFCATLIPMSTVTIQKKEYEELIEKKLRYEYFRQLMESDIFSPPPTRETREVVGDFKKTGLYTQQFLKGLERGLRRSSYFRP